MRSLLQTVWFVSVGLFVLALAAPRAVREAHARKTQAD
jgi:hypothetical protein